MSESQSRRNLHIESLQERLDSLVRFAEERCADVQPPTYRALEDQRVYVNVLVQIALEMVCEVLPMALRPAVRRLLALHKAVWKRDVSRGEGL